MNQDEVVALMESSTSEQEWNENAQRVQDACGGYPSFWFPAIVMSGLVKRVAARWGSDGEIKVTTFGG